MEKRLNDVPQATCQLEVVDKGGMVKKPQTSGR